MPGQCLADVSAAHPQGLPPADALAWIRGIGAGVAYLHDRGIVHRDLKPGNIFSDEGLVKVGDYGLSKFISCSRRSGHTESIGTVHYMAPEVANGRYGKEIDIYALGIMLYEMLTGRVPFDGESVGEVLMKHLTAQPDVSMLAEPYRGVVARAGKDPATSAITRWARCSPRCPPSPSPQTTGWLPGSVPGSRGLSQFLRSKNGTVPLLPWRHSCARGTSVFAGRKLGQSPPKHKPVIAFVVKSRRVRLAELLGSMLGGALVVLAMSVVMVLLNAYYRVATPRPEQCAWLAFVGIAGAWAVLITAKFWEGTSGEAVLRRFIRVLPASVQNR